MKLAITSEGEGLQSLVDPRFGRAKFFIVMDTETGIQAGKKIVDLGVKSLITGHTGPKAFETLRAGDVEIYTGATGTVAEAVELFKAGKLKATQAADVEGHW
jgi:predicted Fe-Mo cluster-binding NifX family protein